MIRVRRDDWVPQGVGGLEGRAWEALRETDSSILVTAGAGAGKTEFLAQKATYLLQTSICPAPNVFWPSALKKMPPETSLKGLQSVAREIRRGALIQ
ncbi:UvrD-helicase domain-containing protein [Aeromonas schubertii]|uniref:UvrD-helicase domain-containing protein n=1 Tax=Aeromonas schubertii TaxID=652 RepID=UPI001910BBFD